MKRSLGGLLGLLPDGVERQAILGGVSLVPFDALFDPHLAAGELAQCLAQFVELILERNETRLVPFPIVVLTVRRDPERRRSCSR